MSGKSFDGNWTDKLGFMGNSRGWNVDDTYGIQGNQ
jgi:hypothetical protein